MAFDPKSVNQAPAIAPTSDPFTANLFAKLAQAKSKQQYAPKLMPGNIQRDPTVTEDNNVNWTSWTAADYLVEIGNVEMVFPSAKPDGKATSPFMRVKLNVLSSTGETPVGEAEHAFFTSGFGFADQTADFVSAAHNVHLKDPDPANPRQPLIVRLGSESVSPGQPLLGKKVLARVTANRSKKPGKPDSKTPGLHGVFVDVSFFPVDQTTGEPIEDKRKG